ncbi:MAG: hypothetical protein KBS74_04445 [Clostridiales bacterium]|nr:hypothetical protein [Candidatus Cacconaster stercorequi]
MKSINEKSKRLIKYLCVVAVIFVMVRASDLLDEKEIIFPEIAALSIGCFLAPKLNWQTSYARMIICIEICAAMGMCIVVLIPLPLWIQVALAFAIGQIVFMLSHTSLAPMISAIVLPVLLQTRSPVYLVATLLLTVLVVAIRILLERVSIMEKNTFSPLPAPVKADWGAFAYRTVCVAILACICLRFEGKFFIAPPLLVAFTELSKVGHPAGKNKPKAILLVSLCALAGAAMRFTLVMKCGFSPTVAALAISVLIIILVECVGLYFPPAGAIGVLALLIPDSAVLPYTIEVVLGIMALALTADVWVKCCQRLTKATE